MRRATSTLYWPLYSLAIVSFMLAPFVPVHAHVGEDHEQVIVHGGHSHEVDAHHHEHGRDHDTEAHDLDCLPHSPLHASHYPIEIEWTAVTGPHSAGKYLTLPQAAARAPPLIPNALGPALIRSDTEFIGRRAYLHPPLRGPPSVD